MISRTMLIFFLSRNRSYDSFNIGYKLCGSGFNITYPAPTGKQAPLLHSSPNLHIHVSTCIYQSQSYTLTIHENILLEFFSGLANEPKPSLYS